VSLTAPEPTAERSVVRNAAASVVASPMASMASTLWRAPLPPPAACSVVPCLRRGSLDRVGRNCGHAAHTGSPTGAVMPCTPAEGAQPPARHRCAPSRRAQLPARSCRTSSAVVVP
jgi:hypothetical protein